MTLLIVLGKSGHISSVEDFATHGLAAQKARSYTDAGLTCQVVADEMREEVEYLMGQMKEKREDGFVREYGVVPNGTRSKGEGARGIGRMIYLPFGGMLEGESIATPPEATSMGLPVSSSLTSSSKVLKFPTEKIVDDLIIRR